VCPPTSRVGKLHVASHGLLRTYLDSLGFWRLYTTFAHFRVAVMVFVAFGTPLALPVPTLDIRFVSTLTADDEERIAGVLLNAVVKLLEDLPLSYALRIETTGAKIFQQTNNPRSELAAQRERDESTPAVPDDKHHGKHTPR
jgi:hypothetical protein